MKLEFWCFVEPVLMRGRKELGNDDVSTAPDGTVSLARLGRSSQGHTFLANSNYSEFPSNFLFNSYTSMFNQWSCIIRNSLSISIRRFPSSGITASKCWCHVKASLRQRPPHLSPTWRNTGASDVRRVYKPCGSNPNKLYYKHIKETYFQHNWIEFGKSSNPRGS